MTVTVTALLVDPPTVAVALGTKVALIVCLPTVVAVQEYLATPLDTATVLTAEPHVAKKRVKSLSHVQRATNRVLRVLDIIYRCSPEGHNAIAYEFIEGTLVEEHDIGLPREILIEQAHDFGGTASGGTR